MTLTRSAPADTMLRLAAPDLDGLLAAIDEPTAYTGPGPRLAMIDPTPERLATARKLVAKGRPVRKRADLWFSPKPLLASGGIAFVFPGLEGEFAPNVTDVADHLGVPAPEVDTSTLGRYGTSVLAVERLLDAAVRRLAIRPSAVAGHSVGEWAAMIAGGIVSGADFDALIARTDLDALRVPGVEFAVVGCPAEQVRPELTPDLVISHENSANQTVICGPEHAIADTIARFRAKAVICQPLPFRSGFHTPMLEPYLDEFRSGIPELPMRPAATPVWSATTATPFPADPAIARELCLRHLLEPVRFRQLIGVLYTSGIRAFVQLGPGQLGSLIEDTLRHDHPNADYLVIPANSAHRPGLDQLRRCALALWTEGADPDFTALDSAPEPVKPQSWPGIARLTELTGSTPLAAELAAFLDETADAVATVLHAARTEQRQVLDVGLATMPYLRDHSLMRQRPGWPDDADLFTIMPATTMVTHLITAAERANPGKPATAISDIHFHKWLPAVPAHQITIQISPRAADQFHVRLGDYAEGIVEFGSGDPGKIWPQPTGESAPEFTAAQLYDEGWLFHGPDYQAITRSIGVSATTMRAELTTPAAPGALLDNLGQVLAQWLIEQRRDRWIALPARVARIEFHAPSPSVESNVDCSIRVTECDHDSVIADGQLSQHGRPLVTVDGWVARRFDSDERAATAYRMPGTATMSERHPDGWWWVAERWRALASRDFYLHRYTGHAERAEFDRLPPAQRRAWLLRLVAIKDAVRGWLWANGADPIYPAELRVHQESGSYRVTGQHGLYVPDLPIIVVQHREVAVASVIHAEITITDWTPGLEGSLIANPPGLPARRYHVRAA